MIFAALVALLVGGFSTAYLSSGEVRYLWRAGYEETRILQSRQPIETLARDTAIPAARRDQFQLVLDVRAYAASLGFEAGDTYTTFADVGRDTLLLVLSVSPRTCICPHTWKYPIVGKVPYKGFFDLNQARATAAAVRGEGIRHLPAPSRVPSPPSAGSRIRCSQRRSRAIRWSWPRSCFTRSPTTRCT